MAAKNAVEVQNITKKFKDFTAVDNVSFSVVTGEIFGFLGPNGAGKTTLIRMLTTLLKPSSGNARVAGCEVVQEPEAVRREIGVVPQAMTSDLDLTGFENMDIIIDRLTLLNAIIRSVKTSASDQIRQH